MTDVLLGTTLPQFTDDPDKLLARMDSRHRQGVRQAMDGPLRVRVATTEYGIALAMREPALGPGHPNTISSRMGLAIARNGPRRRTR